MALYKNAFPTLILGSTLILSACGGGGGGGGSSSGGTTPLFNGNQSEATATSDNADELATAATEAVVRALSSDGVSGALGAETIDIGLDSILEESILKIVSGSALPTGATETDRGSCGGEVRSTFPDNPSGTSFRISIVYDEYCENNILIDGRADSLVTLSAPITQNSAEIVRLETNYNITWSSSVFDIDGELRGVQVCSGDFDSFGGPTCVFSEDFVGISGGTFRVEDVDIDGDDVDATVYDSNFGRIVIDSEGLSQCDSGNFESGTITIFDSTDTPVIEVSFDSCTGDCIVTFDGVATAYPQLFTED